MSITHNETTIPIPAKDSLRKTSFPSKHPRYDWSEWTKQNLPQDLRITDIDNVLRRTASDGTEEVMILEIKSMGAKIDKEAQKITFQLLIAAFKEIHNKLLPVKILGNYYNKRIRFLGFHCIRFIGAEGDFSKPVFLNKERITEYELIEFLSMKKEYKA